MDTRGGGGSLVANGVLNFSSNDGTHGNELWQSDGTAAGTYLVDDINPGAASSDPTPLAVLSGQLVLAANDGTHGSELMKVVASSQTAPPGLVSIPTQQITAGQTLTLDVSPYSYDPNSPALPLSYTLGAGAPAGASIDSTTGVLTWATTANQATGPNSFTVTVSDNSIPALTATQTFTVDVDPVNPPSLATIPPQNVGVGHTFTLDVSQFASDPNYPPFPLTYSLGAGAPAGASIDPTTGVLTWPTAANQVTGPNSFTVTVSDKSNPSLTDTQTFIVSVNPVYPPYIPTIPVQGVNIGQSLTVDLASYAFDSNSPALPLTFSLGSGAPDGASINPTTGVLTFTPGSTQPTGTILIAFVASDNSSPPLTASGTVTVEVGAAGTVRPPALLPPPTYAQLVLVGQTLNYSVSGYASDPNLPALPLTYSLGSGAPSGATINATTGQITWPTASNQALGAYSFPVTVSDTSAPALTASQTYTVGVVPSYSISSPVLSLPPTEEVNIGSTLQVNVSTYASDSNTFPLPLTYSLGSSAPQGASIDPNTGVLTWSVPSGQSTTEPIAIPVIVSNSLTPPTTQSLMVQVFAASAVLPPIIGYIPQQAGVVAQTLQLNVSNYASDPNTPALPLTYSLGSGAPSGASINSTTGMFTWTPTSDQLGLSFISFTVTNSETTPVTWSFAVDVSQYSPPTLKPIKDQTATTNQPFSLDVSQFVTDPNAPPLTLTYALGIGAPTGASINPTTGLLTWTPLSNQTGSYSFTVTVSDSQKPPLTVSDTFTVQVSALAPVLQPIPTQNATIGTELTLNLGQYASDPNSPPLFLIYSLPAGAPAGASIENGVFTWTPGSSQPLGPTTVSFTVTNDQTTPVTGSFTVNVAAAPIVAPAIASIPVEIATIGKTFTMNFSLYATDPNTPALSLSYKLGPGAPSEASIDPISGILTWPVPSGQAIGSYPFTVDVTDTKNTTIAGFTVAVSTIPVLPPVLNPIPSQNATIGQPFSFNVSPFASDPNTPPLTLTYTLGSGAPAGANINLTTGLITWTPASNQPTGQASITVIVSDSNSPPLTASGTLMVSVSAAIPPVIAPPTIGQIPTQSVNVGQSLQLNVSNFASDPNSPPLPLSYSLGAGAPTGASINPTTGVLSWTVGANQQIGTYPITIQVSDNGSPQRSASETFNITVVDPGPAPMITQAKVTTKKGFAITLTFNEPVNPATAANPNNYILTAPAKKPKSKKKPTPPPTRIKLSVSYNQATNQVILKGPKTVKTSPALTLTVVGTGPSGIAKMDGWQLAGRGGQPGTNYVASVTTKAVRPIAAVLGNTIVVRIKTRSADSAPVTEKRAGVHDKVNRLRPFFQVRPGGPKPDFHPNRFAAYLTQRSMPKG